MRFTIDKYPKYAIRLKSGKLAYSRRLGTREKAVVFFTSRDLAREWQRKESRGGTIVELGFDSWWHTLVEPPQFKYMAIVLNHGPQGIGIIEVTKALDSFVELSRGGEELSATDFLTIGSREHSAVVAAVAADANPHLRKVLDKIHDDIQSTEIVTPTVFRVSRELTIDYIDYPVFDELDKNVAADLMINTVREGNLAVGLVAATAEESPIELRFATRPCKPQTICVFYEEKGLALRCRTKGGALPSKVSDWILENGEVACEGRFYNIFKKASVLGLAPRTSEELAQEMRRDLIRLARAKEITHKIRFTDLMSYCSQSEIERLVRKWTWQRSALPDTPGGVLDYLPLDFVDATIDPDMQ